MYPRGLLDWYILKPSPHCHDGSQFTTSWVTPAVWQCGQAQAFSRTERQPPDDCEELNMSLMLSHSYSSVLCYAVCPVCKVILDPAECLCLLEHALSSFKISPFTTNDNIPFLPFKEKHFGMGVTQAVLIKTVWKVSFWDKGRNSSLFM